MKGHADRFRLVLRAASKLDQFGILFHFLQFELAGLTLQLLLHADNARNLGGMENGQHEILQKMPLYWPLAESF